MSQFYSCAITSQRPTRFKFKYQEYMTSCKRLKKRCLLYTSSHLFLFVFTISMFQKVAFADTIKEIADYALKSNAAMVRCGGSRLCW